MPMCIIGISIFICYLILNILYFIFVRVEICGFDDVIDSYRKLVYDNKIEEITTILTSTLLGNFISWDLLTLSLCMIKLITFR